LIDNLDQNSLIESPVKVDRKADSVIDQILSKSEEESKTANLLINPETDYFRDFLISNLTKLARYDKTTLKQLLDSSNDEASYTQANEFIPSDLLKFKEFGFDEHQLSQISLLVSRTCTHKKEAPSESKPESEFVQIMADYHPVLSIEDILVMANSCSSGIKLLNESS